MYDEIEVECPDQAAHFKEPLCTIILTYGYVKDIVERLSFNRVTNALKTLDPEPPPTCPFI